MSTNATIGEKRGSSWRGRHHQWDGYPTALGRTLFHVANGVFGGNVEAMLDFLLREHKGWSSINGADWTKPPGYVEAIGACRRCGKDDRYDHKEKHGHEHEYPRASDHGPKCYCHGSRSEKLGPYVTPDNAPGPWAYIFDAKRKTFDVLHSEDKGWVRVAVVDLREREPEWETIECGEKLERCRHRASYHDKTICEDCDGKLYQDGGGHTTNLRHMVGRDCRGCVDVGDLKGKVREAYFADQHSQKANWHVYDPRVCRTCRGTGKAPPEKGKSRATA